MVQGTDYYITSGVSHSMYETDLLGSSLHFPNALIFVYLDLLCISYSPDLPIRSAVQTWAIFQ